MWRGPMLHKALEQFLVDVHWGEPDFLVLDLPPGTGDVAMSIAQFVPRAEVLVVTTPQVAAERVAQRAAVLARQLRLPVQGSGREPVVVHRRRRQALRAFRSRRRRDSWPSPLAWRCWRQIPFPACIAPGAVTSACLSRHPTRTARQGRLLRRLPSVWWRSDPGGCTGQSSRSAERAGRCAGDRTECDSARPRVASGRGSGILVGDERAVAAVGLDHERPPERGSRRPDGASPARASRRPRRVSLDRRRREAEEEWTLAPGATRSVGAGSRAIEEARRSVADLFRARSGPDPALGGVPAPGGQDPGLHLPGRPPADSAHPRARGRSGRERDLAGVPVERRSDRGHRPRPRLRPRPRRPRQRGGAVAVSCRRASTTRSGALTSLPHRSTCAPRPWTGSATTPGRARHRPRPRARSSRSPTGSPTAPTTSRTRFTRRS